MEELKFENLYNIVRDKNRDCEKVSNLPNRTKPNQELNLNDFALKTVYGGTLPVGKNVSYDTDNEELNEDLSSIRKRGVSDVEILSESKRLKKQIAEKQKIKDDLEKDHQTESQKARDEKLIAEAIKKSKVEKPE